jgi:uncharacterized membrane protein
MKCFFYSFLIAIILSCQTLKSSAQNDGRVTSEKIKNNSDSSLIYGFISELTTGDKLKLSDIWIGNQRFECDTNGKFQIQIKPGNYKVEARSFGFKNLKHEIHIKRGESEKLMFYLIPYKDEKPYKRIH